MLKECVNTLAAEGDQRKFDANKFDSLCSKYTSLITFQFAGKKVNIHEMLVVLMAPPIGVIVPEAPLPANAASKK